MNRTITADGWVDRSFLDSFRRMDVAQPHVEHDHVRTMVSHQLHTCVEGLRGAGEREVVIFGNEVADSLFQRWCGRR